MTDLGGVGGQPPRAASVGGCEPDVVFGDKDEKLTVNMRIPKITSRSHAVYLIGCRQPRFGGYSQPRSEAMRSASARLRAPVFWMQADR